MTSTAVRFWGRTAQCSDHSVSILPHFNKTCATENYICKNFDVKKSYSHTEVLRKAAWINLAVCLYFTVMSVKKIYSIWIKERRFAFRFLNPTIFYLRVRNFSFFTPIFYTANFGFLHHNFCNAPHRKKVKSKVGHGAKTYTE